MDTSRLKWLIERYHQDTASPGELKELADLVAASGGNQALEESLADIIAQRPEDGTDLAPYEHLADRVLSHNKHMHSLRRGSLWKWAAAACLLLAVSATALNLLRKQQENREMAAAPVQKAPVIQPGSYGAVLTLSDGTDIMLDSAGGKVASQNGADVVVANNQVAYRTTGETADAPVYNTLSTPKGRQFRLQLPDGTMVWLNAGSSIRYPTVFRGKERVVGLQGEAYFEVAKNAAMPFSVRINDQASVLVTGTHFNVNAYSNEPDIATTLLEGSVRFEGRETVTLRPGQQSRLNLQTSKLSVRDDVETDKVIAWKNGLFDFSNAGLKEVMNQLERWYDIDVVYEKNVRDIRFFGKMTRNITLNDLLMILERSKVHFRIEGRKLVVLP